MAYPKKGTRAYAEYMNPHLKIARKKREKAAASSGLRSKNIGDYKSRVNTTGRMVNDLMSMFKKK